MESAASYSIFSYEGGFRTVTLWKVWELRKQLHPFLVLLNIQYVYLTVSYSMWDVLDGKTVRQRQSEAFSSVFLHIDKYSV